jgi:23S rRNA (uridine2552-2'-O)-methyltransferase
MARSKSSERWLNRHFSDAYVKKAQQAGYRSRAAFKLMELNERDRFLRPGMRVVDLGAAPGGWSQVAVQIVGPKGKVYALDILPMSSLAGVEFLQGDFTESEVLEKLLAMLHGERIGLVISDMAPNISGMDSIDQPRSMYLVELALDFAKQVLAPGGDLVVKVFQGAGFDELRAELRKHFRQVLIRKPKASRPSSREVYIVARHYSVA